MAVKDFSELLYGNVGRVGGYPVTIKTLGFDDFRIVLAK